MKNYSLLTLLALTGAILWSCKDSSDNTSNSTNAAESTAASTSPFDQYYQDLAAENAQHISTVFADPTPGKEVVIQGEIMGKTEPFIDSRAMVMLGDPTKITPCNRNGCECTTPWDNCCEDPQTLKKSVTTIQFLDNAGKVIKHGLKGYKGIKELSFLTVKGTIAEGSNTDNLLINAQAFHITDPSPFINASPVSSEEGVTIKTEGDVFIYSKE